MASAWMYYCGSGWKKLLSIYSRWGVFNTFLKHKYWLFHCTMETHIQSFNEWKNQMWSLVHTRTQTKMQNIKLGDKILYIYGVTMSRLDNCIGYMGIEQGYTGRLCTLWWHQMFLMWKANSFVSATTWDQWQYFVLNWCHNSFILHTQTAKLCTSDDGKYTVRNTPTAVVNSVNSAGDNWHLREPDICNIVVINCSKEIKDIMYRDSCTNMLPRREFFPIYMLNSEKEGFTILHSTIFL